jgi:hypothetical protein
MQYVEDVEFSYDPNHLFNYEVHNKTNGNRYRFRLLLILSAIFRQWRTHLHIEHAPASQLLNAGRTSFVAAKGEYVLYDGPRTLDTELNCVIIDDRPFHLLHNTLKPAECEIYRCEAYPNVILIILQGHSDHIIVGIAY